ncbi:hypothetical protein ACGFZP_13400 [Kitasatospora sp. NPDC048239]|uniref:hypothetical protein n=1 Tax=Kitasatospora sp. NPDC048239 TaxID=3364046 RepID=UPI0037205ED7
MTTATVTVEYRPPDGEPREVPVTNEQLHGRACIHDATHPGPLHPHLRRLLTARLAGRRLHHAPPHRGGHRVTEDSLTIEVVGQLDPVTLPQEDALRRLWRQVVELDVSEAQHEAMRRQLCGEAPEALATLDVEGSTGWTLDLRHGAQAVLRLSRPDARSPQQRIRDRYVPVQLPATGRCPGLWAVRDTTTGDLAREEDENGRPTPLRFAIADGARAWVARQVTLASYRATRSQAAGGAL